MAHIVVAPDSFKGSVDAGPAAAKIAQGWLTVRPHDTVTTLPQADGGEGTLTAIHAASAGSQLHGPISVQGPDGRPVNARWLELADGTAVVELAMAAGLPLMQHLDPLGASTWGLGTLLGHVLDAQPRALIIGLGGSATTDGAAGAFGELGLRYTGSSHSGDWRDYLDSVDLGQLRPPPPGGVELLTDVDAPLLGPRGAAAVFAPQKGADAAQVKFLEKRLLRWASALESAGAPAVAEVPGAGAAGGAAYGFMALWNATATPGAARIARMTGLDTALHTADLLITGEGRFDATSLTGKVVGHGLALGGSAGVPTTVIAGDLAHEPNSLIDPESASAGNASRVAEQPAVRGISLTELAGSSATAQVQAHRWLVEAGARAAREFSA